MVPNVHSKCPPLKYKVVVWVQAVAEFKWEQKPLPLMSPMHEEDKKQERFTIERHPDVDHALTELNVIWEKAVASIDNPDNMNNLGRAGCSNS